MIRSIVYGRFGPVTFLERFPVPSFFGCVCVIIIGWNSNTSSSYRVLLGFSGRRLIFGLRHDRIDSIGAIFRASATQKVAKQKKSKKGNKTNVKDRREWIAKKSEKKRYSADRCPADRCAANGLPKSTTVSRKTKSNATSETLRTLQMEPKKKKQRAAAEIFYERRDRSNVSPTRKSPPAMTTSRVSPSKKILAKSNGIHQITGHTQENPSKTQSNPVKTQ